MQHIITLDVLSAVSEKWFSLDELVIETKALFEKEGMAGVVGLILRLVDEKVCMDIVAGKRNAENPCCGRPRYGHQGLLDRQFRTSVGTVKIRWRRPDKTNNVNNRGELRVALGVDKRGQIAPLGAFSGASWEQIASAIKGARADKGPVANMLVSDGERGLCDALGKLCCAGQELTIAFARE